jgi:hypothetical protein
MTTANLHARLETCHNDFHEYGRSFFFFSKQDLLTMAFACSPKQKKSNNQSGTEMQKAKETAAEIMRQKQAAGRVNHLATSRPSAPLPLSPMCPGVEFC